MVRRCDVMFHFKTRAVRLLQLHVRFYRNFRAQLFIKLEIQGFILKSS